MNRNSTLFVITDGKEDESEIFNAEDLIDPEGQANQELADIFRNIEYSPPDSLLIHLLTKA